MTSKGDHKEIKRLVHCSTGKLGGAERSLLQEWRDWKKPCLFLLPEGGEFQKTLEGNKIPCMVHSFPNILYRFQQRKNPIFLILLYSFPLAFATWKYSRIIAPYLKEVEDIVSSGVKSHLMLLAFAPFYREKIIYNIRDFIQPKILRSFLSRYLSFFKVRVQANSQVVAFSYHNTSVVYPQFSIGQIFSIAKPKNPVLVGHLAYFAPYKGQDLFLEYASRIARDHPEVEFYLAGDVIYPGREYRDYKEKVLDKISDYGLSSKVKVLGEVADVPLLLSRTHALLHCTREPEPFGRVVMEALLSGCEVLCHRGSGVCELVDHKPPPSWLAFDRKRDHVFVTQKPRPVPSI